MGKTCLCFFLKIRSRGRTASCSFPGCVLVARKWLSCWGTHFWTLWHLRWSRVTNSPIDLWPWRMCVTSRPKWSKGSCAFSTIYSHLPHRDKGLRGPRGWWNPKAKEVCALKSPYGRSACRTPNLVLYMKENIFYCVKQLERGGLFIIAVGVILI